MGDNADSKQLDRKRRGWWHRWRWFIWPKVKCPFQCGWAWGKEAIFDLRVRFHRCHWDEGDLMGRYYVHDCTVPGCMKTKVGRVAEPWDPYSPKVSETFDNE